MFSIDPVDPGATPDPELLALVQTAASGPPYNYAAGEIAPATEWVPPLIRQSLGSFVARDADQRPVGYVLVVPLTGHAEALEAAPLLGVQPETTCYLAELGVAPSAQRQGLAHTLVNTAVDQVSAGATAIAVRTLAHHHTAIRLYQRSGFHLVPDVRQTRKRRPRLFLVRDLEAVHCRR